jgi:hypothetical protein
MTSTWQIFSSICTPTTSGTSYLAFSTLATPIFATGTFYLAGMTFAPVNPLPSNVALQAVGPYGVGPTIALPAGTPLPHLQHGSQGQSVHRAGCDLAHLLGRVCKRRCGHSFSFV